MFIPFKHDFNVFSNSNMATQTGMTKQEKEAITGLPRDLIDRILPHLASVRGPLPQQVTCALRQLNKTLLGVETVQDNYDELCRIYGDHYGLYGQNLLDFRSHLEEHDILRIIEEAEFLCGNAWFGFYNKCLATDCNVEAINALDAIMSEPLDDIMYQAEDEAEDEPVVVLGNTDFQYSKNMYAICRLLVAVLQRCA